MNAKYNYAAVKNVSIVKFVCKSKLRHILFFILLLEREMLHFPLMNKAFFLT